MAGSDYWQPEEDLAKLTPTSVEETPQGMSAQSDSLLKMGKQIGGAVLSAPIQAATAYQNLGEDVYRSPNTGSAPVPQTEEGSSVRGTLSTPGGGYLGEVAKQTPTTQLGGLPAPTARVSPSTTGFEKPLADLRTQQPTRTTQSAGATAQQPTAPTVQVIKGTNVRNEVPLNYSDAGMKAPAGAVPSGTPMLREPSVPNVRSAENMEAYRLKRASYDKQTQNLADIEKAKVTGEYGLKTEEAKGKSALDLQQLDYKKTKQGEDLFMASQGKEYLKSLTSNWLDQEQQFLSDAHKRAANQVNQLILERNWQGAKSFVQDNVKALNFMANFERDPAMKTDASARILKQVPPELSTKVRTILGSPGMNESKEAILRGYIAGNLADTLRSLNATN